MKNFVRCVSDVDSLLPWVLSAAIVGTVAVAQQAVAGGSIGIDPRRSLVVTEQTTRYLGGMMRILLRVGLASSLALGIILVPVSSASAGGTDGRLCHLVSNAYQYEEPNTNLRPERTVHEGHHFRWHDDRDPGFEDSDGRVWVYGHSGESSEDDGWIIHSTRSGHVNLKC